MRVGSRSMPCSVGGCLVESREAIRTTLESPASAARPRRGRPSPLPTSPGSPYAHSMRQMLFYAAIGLGVVSLLFLAGSVQAFRRRRWIGTLGAAGTGALFLSLAALSSTLGISTQGYRALTAEVLAATVTTVPTGPRAFQAFVEFPDGRDTTLHLAGDQVLVDAHILKWHPLANMVGLHTLYELDRLTGRYAAIDDEREEPRTVHSLKAEKPVDLFNLARRYSLLALLVDAEYGSATYIEVERPARFEVRVSTTGLLIRPAELR